MALSEAQPEGTGPHVRLNVGLRTLLHLAGVPTFINLGTLRSVRRALNVFDRRRSDSHSVNRL